MLASNPVNLYLHNNGLLQTPNLAYTRSGATITFLAPYIPLTTDVLLAFGVGNSPPGPGGATTLADLLKPALRKAGITQLPGIIPNIDQYAELIPAVNRMMGSWNLDGHRIYTSKIESFPLTSGQKIYSIGPGGDFDTERPIYIKIADLEWPTSPVLRTPIWIMDDNEWARIPIQDISGAPIYAIYYDGGFDDNGRGKIYVYFQPSAGYSLQLYSWQALQSSFTATTDVVVLPPGYEEAIVDNLALKAISLYPLDSIIARNPVAMQEAKDQARRSLEAVQILNVNCPDLISEASQLGGNRGDRGLPYKWWIAPGA